MKAWSTMMASGEDQQGSTMSESGIIQTFSQYFIAQRKSRGMTQCAMAKKLGYGRATIQAWEHGDRKPNDSALGVIASYFEVDAVELKRLPLKPHPSLEHLSAENEVQILKLRKIAESLESTLLSMHKLTQVGLMKLERRIAALERGPRE